MISSSAPVLEFGIWPFTLNDEDGAIGSISIEYAIQPNSLYYYQGKNPLERAWKTYAMVMILKKYLCTVENDDMWNPGRY